MKLLLSVRAATHFHFKTPRRVKAVIKNSNSVVIDKSVDDRDAGKKLEKLERKGGLWTHRVVVHRLLIVYLIIKLPCDHISLNEADYMKHDAA